MEVILLEKVGKLGALGDRVTVKGRLRTELLAPTGDEQCWQTRRILLNLRHAVLSSRKPPKSKSMLRPFVQRV